MIHIVRSFSPGNGSFHLRVICGLLALIAFALSTTLFASVDSSAKGDSTATKRFTIGVSDWTGYPANIQGFRDGLTAAGLSEEHVELLIRSSYGDKAIQKQIAEEFLQQRVDMVYSLTTPGTSILKATVPESLPIVYSIITYPADSGLIQSLDYSGNNLVGTSNYVPPQYYIEMLNSFLPDLKRLAVFSRLGEPNSKIQAVSIRRLLRRQSVEVIHVEVSSLEELRIESEKLLDQVDAFMTTTDTLMQSGGEDILIELSLSHKIPILSSNKSGIENGATFGPVVDFYQIGKMAVQVLMSNKAPSAIASKLQLPPTQLVNRKSVEWIGLTVPDKGPSIEYVE